MSQDAPLKPSDIERYLTAKKAMKACAACGSRAFDTTDEVKENARFAILSFLFPRWDRDRMLGHGAVVWTCRNCGLMRIFDRDRIVKWVSTNPLN